MEFFARFRCGVVLTGLGSFGMAILPGCGDGTPSSGGQVKVDTAEAAKREQMIQDLYKSKQARKGPSGRPSPNAKR